MGQRQKPNFRSNNKRSGRPKSARGTQFYVTIRLIMQTIVLKKSSSSHVLSHIYEHVYSIALDTLLRESGLMSIIDYDIYATTVAQVEVEKCVRFEIKDEQAFYNDLADSYAGFIQSEAFAVNEFDELEMHISLHPDVDLSGIEAVANNSLAELLDSKSIERLLSELQDVSAMEFPPSNTFHYKDLKIEMNSDMWRQVATAYNLGSLKKEGHVIVEPVTR